MELSSRSIDGGFVEPVIAAQGVFRAVMDAMARPGTSGELPPLARPPAPLSPEAGAVALTLCDHDTPVWLDPPLSASEEVRAWLGFHTGAPLAFTPAEAHFALVSRPGELIALENFAQGSQEYPDRSATLILQTETLTGGEELVLTGPGIETSTTLAPQPLPRHFATQWRQNNSRFPRGIDLVLVAPGALACLPRTTRIAGKDA
ncbi:phosphonate C-P lyase system protein PhnH [Nitratireductor mangrovi]|uniref:Phosphonate C-P lyase system protein PhnH n=1 Tax=Nitratireductor mangrovi TaxID=2599600 RepID=A0A5B8L2M6_9HYPH|nr:phosphonate C-P lyase system protein PhnH [Nitratireductor mangrovi]QDZ02211.1 phosphonate C-P lyase system protein PhnH [Nitratireductor mangrovi]